jgi:hypothetical protein
MILQFSNILLLTFVNGTDFFLRAALHKTIVSRRWDSIEMLWRIVEWVMVMIPRNNDFDRMHFLHILAFLQTVVHIQ